MALQDLLDEILEDLELAEDLVDSAPGPLSDPPKTAVAAKLTSVLSTIENAFNQLGDIGTADTSGPPRTLPGIAGECVGLADNASTSNQETPPDINDVANQLKTIAWLIDVSHGYREKAGIN